MRCTSTVSHSWHLCRSLSLAIAVLAASFYAPAVHAQVVVSGGGLVYVEEGPAAALAGDPAPANLAIGGTAFALDFLTAPHVISNVNDGKYGNNFSWIPGNNVGTEGRFIGIDLGATAISDIQSIAFGRSNVLGGDPCGVCTDRNFGLYTLQYTQFANPDNTLVGNVDPALGWATIGTIDNQGAGGQFTQPHLRHRYNFDPVDATGVRLLVAAGVAIDEIELYDVAGANTLLPPPPPPQRLDLSPATGFNISWDGNDGDFFDPTPPPTGSVVPNNLALASNGATPFTSSDFGGQHSVDKINDGIYGNLNSWISNAGDTEPQASAGVDLDGLFNVTSVAWGRDNGNGEIDNSVAGTDNCGGQCGDRFPGVYTIQVTTDANPGIGGNWTTIATVDLKSSEDDVVGGGFTGYLRHEFEVSTDTGGPIVASGVRILVPGAGFTAIDEIEVYGSAVPEPATFVLALLAVVGLCGFGRRGSRA